ncbi:MAG: hypothetical protein IAF58_13750 [Leptolyngbya sp.]|nr:hypothetical protein [Candidatus Melainabacteria bacterium]
MDFIEAFRQACEMMDQGVSQGDVDTYMLGVSLLEEYELPFISETTVIPHFPDYPKLSNELYRAMQSSFSATTLENQLKAMRLYADARRQLKAHLEENVSAL